jgi:hypothetical protein
MSDKALLAIRASVKCGELVLKVPVEEQKRYGMEIYGDLTAWLADPGTANIEERYVSLGVRRAQQGVPFSDLLWAVCIAQEQLWTDTEQECLLDEPVEFWGGVHLLGSLTQFFDRALYYTSLGYEKARKGTLAASPAA